MTFWYMFPISVTESSVSSCISTLWVQFQEDPNTQFTLYISSTGGDVDSAIRFYDFVKSTDMKINTVGFGQVDSAAIILFLCGNVRTLITNTRVRLHLPGYNINGQNHYINMINEEKGLLNSIDKRYFKILSTEIGKSDANLRRIFTKGKILSAESSKDFGIATEVKDKMPKP